MGDILIIAELTVVPIGTSNPSVSRYVKIALDEIKKIGLKYQSSAMGTIIESENIDDIFLAIKRIREVLFGQDILRLVTTLKLDERRDKEASIDQKLKSILE